MADKKFISFDLGAESGRCIVSVLNEKKVTLHEVHRFTTHNVKYEKGFFWDILAICDEITTGLKKAGKLFGNQFDGIGVDTWGVDYVLVDADGRILGYPYNYRDDRTDNIMEEAFKIVGKEELYAKTGIQFAQFNTIFQLFAETKTKQNLLNVADKMLLMPDFLNYMLSGVMKAEYSIVSTTGLADPVKRDWDRELIGKFGFPEKIFPEVVEPGTVLGNLLPAIAKKTGLSENIPVIAIAGHDTGSAVAAVPASEGKWAFLSSGTWSLMGIELRQPSLTPKSMEYNFTNEGGVEKTTRFLKNILGLWPVQECRRYWLENGQEYNYAYLTEMAKTRGFVKAWVDLNDIRFLKAGEMPEKIAAYLNETGQGVNDGVGNTIAVVLESLAFCYRGVIKEIEEVTGVKVEKLHAVGGGIQNELLTQMMSDATGCIVYAGPVEGTVVGNVGMQAIASGEVKDLNEWRQIVAGSFDLKTFHPVNAQYFDDNYENYMNIIKK